MTFDEIVSRALAADESARKAAGSSFSSSQAEATIHASRVHALAVLAQAVAANEAAKTVSRQIQAAYDKI